MVYLSTKHEKVKGALLQLVICIEIVTIHIYTAYGLSDQL